MGVSVLVLWDRLSWGVSPDLSYKGTRNVPWVLVFAKVRPSQTIFNKAEPINQWRRQLNSAPVNPNVTFR